MAPFPCEKYAGSARTRATLGTIYRGYPIDKSMDGTERPTQELFLLIKRVAQFTNLWTIYRDVLSGHYSPSVGEDKSTPVPYQMRVTVLFLVYAFFCSLVEDGDGALNAFRIWRAYFPDGEAAIEAVEKPRSADAR